MTVLAVTLQLDTIYKLVQGADSIDVIDENIKEKVATIDNTITLVQITLALFPF